MSTKSDVTEFVLFVGGIASDVGTNSDTPTGPIDQGSLSVIRCLKINQDLCDFTECKSPIVIRQCRVIS